MVRSEGVPVKNTFLLTALKLRPIANALFGDHGVDRAASRRGIMVQISAGKVEKSGKESANWLIDLAKETPTVVVDTNALFQAMRNDLAYLRAKYGTSAEYDWGIEASSIEYAGSRLFTLLHHGVRLATSQHIRREVDRVLERHRGKSADEYRDGHFEALRQLLSNAIQVEPTSEISACRDPDDNRILECAVAAQADLIITEDLDLLSLASYNGIPILTIVEFMQRTGRTERSRS